MSIRLVITGLLLLHSALALADISGKAGKTTTGCSSCHTGSNSGSTVSAVLSGPSTLAAGATGAYRFTVSGPPGATAGLDVGTSAGTLQVVSPGTKILNGEVVNSINHTMSGGSISFDLKLVAPATPGTVTLKAVGLSCNGQEDKSNDKEKITSLAVMVTGAGNTAPTVATAASATPATVTAKSTTLIVLGADNAGEPALKYSWTKTSGPGTVTFSATGTNAAKSTTATFGAAGAYGLTVAIADAEGLTATSVVGVTVSATLSALAVTPASVSVASGTTKQFSRSAVDQFGVALASQPAVTWAVGGGGTINASGLFTAGPTAGGPFNVSATAGGVTGTAAVTVSAGAPPTVATPVSASPSTVSQTTTQVTVLGADAAGEASLSYAWTSTGPGPVSFTPSGTNAAKSSTATFSKAGSYLLTATLTNAFGMSVSSSVSVTVSATLAAVTVSPSQASVPLAATQSFVASAVDQFGATLTAQPVFSWAVSGGGTVSAGLFTAGTTAGGPYTVTASAGGKSGTATLTVTAGSPPSVATPAAANPAAVSGKTTQLSVLGADASGEANLTYTWSKISGPGTVTFVPNGSNSAKGSTATFSTPGNYLLAVSLTNPASLSQSSSVGVSVASTLSSLSLTPSVVSLTTGSTQQFTAAGVDQFGGAFAQALSPTWTTSGGGTVSASGLFTAGASAGGPFTVTASSGGVSGKATVTVTALTAPTVATPVAATPATVTGTTTQLSVLGADAAGEASLTYLWSCPSGPAPVTFSSNAMNAAKMVTATFGQPGTYPVTVTLTNLNGLSVTSGVTVTVVSAVQSLAVAPASATISVNGSQQFTASAVDQFGSAPATPPVFTWVLGGGCVGCTLSGAGLFQAGAAPGGPYPVGASAGGKTGTAQVTLALGSPPSMPQAPWASPNPVVGTSTELGVLGDDPAGEASLTYTWSVSPPGPVFSANGTHSAQATTATFMQPGDYDFGVTVRNKAGLTASANLVVKVVVAVLSLDISPASAQVPLFRTQQFTVSAFDQFGHTVAPTPLVVWSATGAGSIDSTGLFGAGGVPGPAKIRAQAGGVTRELTIQVIDSEWDATVPTVTLLSPIEGASVSGRVLLRAVAVDKSGIAKLVFRVDGDPVAEFSEPTQAVEARLDTATLANGSHVVDAVATDKAGNSATSAPANLTVQNGATQGGAPGGCGCTAGLGPAAALLLGLALLRSRRRPRA